MFNKKNVAIGVGIGVGVGAGFGAGFFFGKKKTENRVVQMFQCDCMDGVEEIAEAINRFTDDEPETNDFREVDDDDDDDGSEDDSSESVEYDDDDSTEENGENHEDDNHAHEEFIEEGDNDDINALISRVASRAMNKKKEEKKEDGINNGNTSDGSSNEKDSVGIDADTEDGAANISATSQSNTADKAENPNGGDTEVGSKIPSLTGDGFISGLSSFITDNNEKEPIEDDTTAASSELVNESAEQSKENP